MDNPRADKVAVVDEVRERLGAADASVVTEYRGLSVSELADLRRQLAAAGAQYKIYKNTLVRRAIAGGDLEAIEPLLTGPTALTFVSGDISAVAKALRDFSRGNPHLVVKGGFFDGGLLSSGDLSKLADLPSRDVLLAQLAGALVAPLRQMAGALQALPRNLAYGLAALADQRGAGEPAPAAAEVEATTTDEAAAAATDTEAAAEAEAPAAEAEAPAAETAETAETAESAEAPAAEATEEAPAEASDTAEPAAD
jgi:large subunit ribosomal protein L10